MGESRLLYKGTGTNAGRAMRLLKSMLLPPGVTSFGIVNGDYDYDPNKEYHKGDYAIFNEGDNMYIIQAKKDIPAGDPFNQKLWNIYNFENSTGSGTASSALDDRPDIVANIISHTAANNGMYGKIIKTEKFEEPTEFIFNSTNNEPINPLSFTLLNDINTSDAFLLYFDIMFFDSNGKRSYIDPLFESDFTVEIFNKDTGDLLETYKPNDNPIPNVKLSDFNKHIFYVNTYAAPSLKVKISNIHFAYPADAPTGEEYILKFFDIYALSIE